MARQRTGTLEYDERRGTWTARVTVTHPDGTTSRPRYSLETDEEPIARRKLAALVRQLEAAPPQAPPTRFEDFATEWLAARVERGVAQAESEKGWLKNHIVPVLGNRHLGDIRPRDISAVLDAAITKGLSQQTIVHLHATMRLVFHRAWKDEIITENPVLKVDVPQIREVHKQRTILTDEEIAALWACDDVDIELRLLVLVARCEGGMRTRDLTAWDWEMVDRRLFSSCTIPRTKTGRPQRLEIPEVLQAPLRRWWVDQGEPASGPVFPVRRGARKGEARKARGVSFADRLRRALLQAGIDRHELHHETATSLPVDFHSCRRAFATALDDAGVPTREAMHLTGHSSEAAHRRYVMNLGRVRKIPAAALPRIGGTVAANDGACRLPALPDAPPQGESSANRPKANGPARGPSSLPLISERDTRLELATLSLGS